MKERSIFYYCLLIFIVFWRKMIDGKKHLYIIKSDQEK